MKQIGAGDTFDLLIFTIWAFSNEPLTDIQDKWCLNDIIKAKLALEYKGVLVAESMKTE